MPRYPIKAPHGGQCMKLLSPSKGEKFLLSFFVIFLIYVLKFHTYIRKITKNIVKNHQSVICGSIYNKK